MSRSVALYLAQTIAEADFVQLVADLGGWSQGDENLDVGFSDGDAHVWIYGARDGLDDPREQPDGYNYPLPFGEPSKAHLDMVLSHEVESAALALKIAIAFLRKWPGVAHFALTTALVPNDAVDALPETVTDGFYGREVQVVLSQKPELHKLIDEFKGIVIDPSDEELRDSTEVMVRTRLQVDSNSSRAVGIVPADGADIWIFEAEFDQIEVDWHDLLSGIVRRHVGHAPAAVIRVIIDSSEEHREYAQAVALAFAKRVSRLAQSAMVGLFYVTLEAAQAKFVLDSGNWPLIA